MDNGLVETLRASTEALEEAGLTYAITGSIASSRHGEPVSSLDVDLIVTGTPNQVVAAARKLGPRFYAPEEMLEKAAKDHGFANLIDNQTSFKVDLSFVQATGYLGEVLQRGARNRLERAELPVRHAGGHHPDEVAVAEGHALLEAMGKRPERRPRQRCPHGLEISVPAGPNPRHPG